MLFIDAGAFALSILAARTFRQSPYATLAWSLCAAGWALDFLASFPT